MAETVGGLRTSRRFERRIAVLALLLALAAAICGVALLWLLPFNLLIRGALAAAWLVMVIAVWVSLLKAVIDPLRGLTNVVEAYRGGDYTLRSSRELAGDALGDLVHEINSLGNTLHEQRLRAMEATALLDKLIGAIDVSIVVFDGERLLRLLNPAASRLLGLPQAEALGRSAVDLGVQQLLAEKTRTRIVTEIAGRAGRWQVTHGTFREGGLAQHLLIVADVREALREEESSAWQRLIRVISHEVNNSLAPIKSLATTLKEMLDELLPPGSTREDALPALQVIADRTDSLQRFLAQHNRLVRMPAPQRRWFPIGALLARLVKLEQAHVIDVQAPEALEVYVDEDQLEQVLINLVKNAIEAHGELQGTTAIAVRDDQDRLIIKVSDEGLGIANPDNLFVPFFTTKPGGSGIGLVLSRQIAEAHEGTLRLENRVDTRGAVATLEIPAAARRSSQA